MVDGEAGATDGGISIKPVDVDHMSLVRYVHSVALRMQAGAALTEDEIDRVCESMYEPEYTAELMSQDLLGAWLGGELTGTAGWLLDKDGCTARIVSVYVRPPFTRMGIGRRLVAEVEDRCRRAGLSRFVLEAMGGSVPFFEKQGYDIKAEAAVDPDGIPRTPMYKSDEVQTSPAEAGAGSEPAPAAC
jgi:GNAT superfamily N-acetyltransferase